MNEETELQAAIANALNRLGFWVERTNAGSTGGVRHLRKGTPDLLIVAPAYGWIEVKRLGEEPNPNQKKWMARASRAGVPHAVVSSVNEAVSIALAWKASQKF